MKRPTSILNTQVFWLIRQVASHVQYGDKPRPWPEAEKIRQAETDLIAWAGWLQQNRRTITADEWQLHEQTVRWAKGILKAWRLASQHPVPIERAAEKVEVDHG